MKKQYIKGDTKKVKDFFEKNRHGSTVQRTEAKENEISRNCHVTIHKPSNRHLILLDRKLVIVSLQVNRNT